MLELFLSYVLIYKYLALFLVALFAGFAIPLPNTAILLASGAFAAQGYMNFYYIVFFGLLGNVLGDNIGYLISYFFGKNILMKIGLRKVINSHKFKELEIGFNGIARSSIFFSRFLFTGLGPTVNFVSGISKVAFKKYFFYEFSGELFYSLIYTGLGYFLAGQWEYISGVLQYFAYVCVVLFLLYIVIRYSIKNGHRKIRHI